jgi:DNA-directed RNA polymerase specialized sigma24 family protein
MNKNIVDQHYLESAMNAAATRTYRLAARHGLSSAEREDIEQSILLELLERYPQYDPAKGSMNTFTGLVSEHRAVELLDQLMKQRIRMTVFEPRDAANDPDFYASVGDGTTGDNVVPLWADDRDLFSDSETLHDIQAALACMNQDQQDLFNLIDKHHDIPTAAKASGMSSATFYRRVDDLRMHLRMFGIRPAA